MKQIASPCVFPKHPLGDESLTTFSCTWRIEAIFGVQLTKMEGTEFEMWAFPMRQDGFGASGSLVKISGYASGANSVVVYFSCADCAVEVEKVAKSGGQIEMGKKSIGHYGHIALVIDSEGNVIGLHSMQ